MNPNNPTHVSSSCKSQAWFGLLSFTASRVGKLAACLMLGVAALSQSAISQPTPNGASSYGVAALADNPVAYWQLDDVGDPSSGTLPAVDYSASGLYSGTYGKDSLNYYNEVESPQPPDAGGFYAGFYDYEGALQTVASKATSVITLPYLNLNTNTVTITMWINPAANEGTYTGLLMNRAVSGDAAGFGFGGSTQNGMAALGYTWNNKDRKSVV